MAESVNLATFVHFLRVKLKLGLLRQVDSFKDKKVSRIQLDQCG